VPTREVLYFLHTLQYMDRVPSRRLARVWKPTAARVYFCTLSLSIIISPPHHLPHTFSVGSDSRATIYLVGVCIATGISSTTAMRCGMPSTQPCHLRSSMA
jgi:hypothetical protein